MLHFIQFVNQFLQLDKVASSDLLGKLSNTTINKIDRLLKSGDVCRHLNFIDKGLAKTFFNNEEKEFIMRFFWKTQCLQCLTALSHKHLQHIRF
jgi:hypothetical protein